MRAKSKCILGEITGRIFVGMYGQAPRGIHKENLGAIPEMDSLEESQEILKAPLKIFLQQYQQESPRESYQVFLKPSLLEFLQEIFNIFLL